MILEALNVVSLETRAFQILGKVAASRLGASGLAIGQGDFVPILRFVAKNVQVWGSRRENRGRNHVIVKVVVFIEKLA
jgi:hypothetical protein